MSIAETTQKIKGFLDSPKGHNVLIIVIIVATALSSFILGRTTRPDSSPVVILTDHRLIVDKTQTKLQQASVLSSELNDTEVQKPTSDGGAYVASSRGKKYYPVGCSAANSLSESNKIYFKTAQEAESKGYTMSSSCN